jgi:hypothetical protein
LAQKEYWGRKLIVSSERINDHFNFGGSIMWQEISLISKYKSVLSGVVNGKPEVAYQQFIKVNEKPGYIFPLSNINYYSAFSYQMTPDEEKEWLYWYKVIWPKLEHVINPNQK